MELKPEDLVIDMWRGANRAGGWSVAPVFGIQIVHRPTGAMVQVDTERSQHKNKALAMSMMEAKVKIILEARRKIAEAQAKVSVRSDGHGGVAVISAPVMPAITEPAEFSLVQLGMMFRHAERIAADYDPNMPMFEVKGRMVRELIKMIDEDRLKK